MPTSSGTTRSASTAPTSTASASPTTATAPTTASRWWRDVDLPGGRVDVRGLRRNQRVQHGRAERDAVLDRRQRAEVLEQAPASGQGRLQPAGGVQVILGLMLATALFAAPSKKTVEVGDNYFAPGTTTVAKGGTVTFKWPSAEDGGDVHDVKLKSGPKGAKKFHSEQASADYAFKRKL